MLPATSVNKPSATTPCPVVSPEGTQGRNRGMPATKPSASTAVCPEGAQEGRNQVPA